MTSIFNRIREQNYKIYNRNRIVLLILWPVFILVGLREMFMAEPVNLSGLVIVAVGVVIGIIWFAVIRFKHE
ncbi:Uncharacterised protein [Halioglobus japonicus]|nr:Uncharacterised protein [Halioglobus japonicus]CAA0113673.1 Uncharacterised protein [Halioglobus japonicus]